jgi:hypothetical protein
MGGSRWSDDHYVSRASLRSSKGIPAFAYDADVRSGRVDKKVHDKLNPHGIQRESRDSEMHPESLAIVILFDVTGSMGSVPVTLQKKLPQLMGLLLKKNYVQHPQVLYGAIGDYFADDIPLQIGQFESGIEMEDDLTNLVLEGGGGGSYEESYQTGLYFIAKHTSIDCFEKRGKKGYLFLIGDEKPYPASSKEELLRILGDTVQSDVTVEDAIRLAQEHYYVFFVIPTEGTSHGHDPVLLHRWEGLLGPQNVLKLETNEAVCETIALAIGLCEGSADLHGAARDLRDTGASVEVSNAALDALGPLAKSVALSKVGTGDLPERTGGSAAVTRL